MGWCYAHKRYESDDNLIDFPVSDTFRDGYYEGGLIPHPSPSYYARPVVENRDEVEEELTSLRKEIGKLRREMGRLKFNPRQETPNIPQSDPDSLHNVFRGEA